MATIPGIRRLFRLPQSESRATRDVSDEIEFHLSMRVEELMARGQSPVDARRQADREFGDAEAAAAELAEMTRRRARQYRRAEVHDWAWRDLRHAFRGLRRDPLFTIGVIVTLALGVGANAAMFGMTDRVLLQPPPHVASPDEVVRIWFQKVAPWGDTLAQAGFAYGEYAALAREAKSVALAAANGAVLPVGTGAAAERADGLAVTAGWFPLLGVRPYAGRFFTAEEDVPKRAARVVVLGHGYWQRRFGGSLSAIGQTLPIGEHAWTIIGIAPPRFNGIDLSPVDAYVPASAWGETFGIEDWHETSRLSWIQLVGRLQPGASPRAAAAELTLLHDRWGRAHGNDPYGDTPDEHALLGPVITARGPEIMRGDHEQSARVTLLLLGVSLIVLLVACANVANLMLARAIRRTRELAIRVALGVGHGRLLSLVLGEALLLSVGGGALGLLLAYQGAGWLAPLLLPGVDWSGGVVAGRVVAFAGLLVLACTLLIAIVPALQALRTDVVTTLRTGAREGGGRRARARRALVIAQAGLSVVLLAGAGVFVRSLQKARAVDFGFDGDRVLVMTWDQRAQERGDSAWIRLYEEAAERVRALPEVAGVALAAFVPGRSNMNFGGMVTGEGDSIPPLGFGGPYANAIDTAFFHTLGIALRRGRNFTAADRAGAPAVMIVDEAFARAVWPDRDPIGECVRLTRNPEAPPADRVCMEVVGVVENAMRHGVTMEPSPQFFRPLGQMPMEERGLFVRARGEESVTLAAAVRDAVQEVAADLPYAEVRTLQSHFDPQLRPWRIGVTLFIAFGGLALLVAAVGLYSIMAYSVTLRRRELGVRQALGARAGQLLALVLRDAAGVLGGGVLLGVILVLLLGGAVRSLLFEVNPRDPLVLAGVSALLLAVGLLATLLPARRAARVEAATVLREE